MSYRRPSGCRTEFPCFLFILAIFVAFSPQVESSADIKLVTCMVLAHLHGFSDRRILSAVQRLGNILERWARIVQDPMVVAMSRGDAKAFLAANGFNQSVATRSTGMDEIDNEMMPKIVVIAHLVLRASPVEVLYTCPSRSFEGLLHGAKPSLGEIPLLAVGRRLRNVVFRFDAPTLEVLEIHSEMKLQLRACTAWVGVQMVGDNPKMAIVYIRKECARAMPRLSIGGVAPVAAYKVSPLSPLPVDVANSLLHLSKVGYACATDIAVVESDANTLSFDQLLEAAQQLDRSQLLRIKGRITLKEQSDLTDFDHKFLKAFPIILQMMPAPVVASKSRSLLMNVHSDEHLPVPIARFDEFIHLVNLQCSRLDIAAEGSVDGRFELFSYDALLRLHLGQLMKHALFIHGQDSTSGCKTQLALATAVLVARGLTELRGLASTQCNIFIANTGRAQKRRLRRGFCACVRL